MKTKGYISYPPIIHLKIAVFFGLFAGLSEVTVHLIKKYVLQEFIFMGVDAFWVIPLINTFVFSGFCIALLVAYKIFPRLDSPTTSIFIFAALSHFNWLAVSFANVSKIAFFALALGLSKQTLNLINSKFKSFTQLPSNDKVKTQNIKDYLFQKSSSNNIQVIFGCVLVLITLFAFIQFGKKFNSWLKYRQLPEVTSKMPNVLLIVLDTVRAESLSLYGYKKNTAPHITELAKTGVVFNQAFAPAPWTLPTHGALFTGQYPHRLATDFEAPLSDTYPTVAEILRDKGYLTAGFVANTVYCSSETGLDRGFVYYEDYTVSFGQAINDSQLLKWILHSKIRQFFGDYQVPGRKTAAEINTSFLEWLSRNRTERPFFVFINYYDAHDPYIPPPEFNSKYPSKPSGGNLKGLGAEYSEDELIELKNSYDETIRYLDYQVGHLFEELDELNLQDTLVIIVSDHGEQFGRHGLVSHANSLYKQLLHVPLIILTPRISGDIQVDETVSIIDIPKTIMDYIDIEEAELIPGTSLSRFWDQNLPTEDSNSPVLSVATPGEGQPEWYPTSKGPMKSLIMDGFHFISNGDGSEELYSLELDYYELNNLASEETEEIQNRFRLTIEALIEED